MQDLTAIDYMILAKFKTLDMTRSVTQLESYEYPLATLLKRLEKLTTLGYLRKVQLNSKIKYQRTEKYVRN